MADPKDPKKKGAKPIAEEGEDWFSAVDEWEKNFELTPTGEGTQPGATKPEGRPASVPQPQAAVAATAAAKPAVADPSAAAATGSPLHPIEVTSPGVDLPMESASMGMPMPLDEPPALDAVPGGPAGSGDEDPFFKLFEPGDMEVTEEPGALGELIGGDLPEIDEVPGGPGESDAFDAAFASASDSVEKSDPSAGATANAESEEAPRSVEFVADEASDDELEISVSPGVETDTHSDNLADSPDESTRVVSSLEVADLLLDNRNTAATELPAIDDDFYDDISITTAPEPTPAPIEEPPAKPAATPAAAKIGADAPTMAFNLNDAARMHARLSDPDSTPLPVGDEEPAPAPSLPPAASIAAAVVAAAAAMPAPAPTVVAAKAAPALVPPDSPPPPPRPTRTQPATAAASPPSIAEPAGASGGSGRWRVPAPHKPGDASAALDALDVLERDPLDENTGVILIQPQERDSFFDESVLQRRDKRESRAVELNRLPLPEPRSILDEVQDRATGLPVESNELLRRQSLFDTERLLASESRAVAQLALAAGRIAEQLLDLTLAADHFETAVASQPDWLIGYDSLRRARLRLGRSDAAAATLDRSSQLATATAVEKSTLVEYRAEILAATGEQGAAMQAVENARAQPGHDAWATSTLALEIAARRREPGRLTEALGSLAKSAESDGERRLAAALQLLVGQAAERAGQPDLAQKAFAAALDLDGGLERAAWGKLRVALRTPDGADDVESGQKLLEFVSPGPVRAALERRLAHDRDRLARPDEAGLIRNLFERASTSDAVGLRSLAEFEQRGGQLDRAIAAYARLATDEADTGRAADLWVTIGDLELQRGGTAAAADAYRRAASSNPIDVRAQKGIERTLSDGGDKQAALDRELGHAQQSRDPGERKAALVRAARLDHELGRSPRALQHLSTILDADAAYAPAIERYVEVAAHMGHPEQWTAIAQRLIAAANAAPNGPLGTAWLERAAVAACGGTDPNELDQAINALADREIGIEPLEWRRLISTFAPTRLDGALAALAADIEMRDETRAAELVYSRIVASQLFGGDIALASTELGRVLALDPLHRPALALARFLATRQGKLADAAQLLAAAPSAVRGEREKVVAQLRFAVALLADSSDPGAALSAFADPRLEREPGVPEVLAELGRRTGSDAEHARLFVGRMAQAGTTDPNHRVALGLALIAIHEQAQKYDRALEVARDLLPTGDVGVTLAYHRLLKLSQGHAALAELALGELRSAAGEPERVAAYHRLAFLDERLRGDIQSAELGYSSIVELDPVHAFAQRNVEQRLLRDNDRAGLVDLYYRAAEKSAYPAQAAAWALDAARLAAQDGPSSEDARRAYELAIARDPSARPALRQLLRLAKQEVGTLPRRASELQARLAAASLDDPRTCAICLTRAGEAELSFARVTEAKRFFEAARAQRSTHLPALLSAWALDLMDAAAPQDASEAPRALSIELSEAVASASVAPTTQAELSLFAAVLALNAGELDRAIADLNAAFTADRNRLEIFERLEQALEQKGDFPALAALYEARLAVEPERRRTLQLRLGSARLYRDRLNDRPRARRELTEVLTLEPQHLAALRQAADLAYEDADWTNAADLLIREAKLETDPTRSHTVFVRLGEIYRVHLPDSKRAIASYLRACKLDADDLVSLQHLSDLLLADLEYKGALQATARLAELETELGKRVVHLHRVAKIYEEGFSDSRRALETLRRAHELDLMHLPAIGELAKYFDRTSDVQSMRVHLDRAIGRFRQLTADKPYDAEAYRALFKIFTWRRTPDRAFLTAGILDYLNAAGTDERALLDRHQSSGAGYPGPSFADPSIDELLFDARIPPGLRILMQRLDEPLSKAQRTDPKRWNLGKNDKLPTRNHPVRDVANRIAADLGIRELDLYVTTAQPRGLIVESGDPLYVILGHLLVDKASEAELRFYLGRALRLAQSKMVPIVRLNPDDAAAFVAGLVRQYVPDFAPRGIDEKAIAAETIRLAKFVPKKLHSELLPFALECTSDEVDLRQIPAALVDAGNRAGLLAAGASAPALRALVRLEDAAQVRGLLSFLLSDDAAEMRRLAGVAVG